MSSTNRSSDSVFHYRRKIVDGPIHHRATGCHKGMGTGSKRVFGMRRHFGINLTHKETIGFKIYSTWFIILIPLLF